MTIGHSAKATHRQPLPITIILGEPGGEAFEWLQSQLYQPDFGQTLVIRAGDEARALDHPLQVSCRAGVVLSQQPLGCACCSIRSDLKLVLKEAPWRFAREGRRLMDRVWLECSDPVGLPSLLQTVLSQAALRGDYQLDGLMVFLPSLPSEMSSERALAWQAAAVMADDLRPLAQTSQTRAVSLLSGWRSTADWVAKQRPHIAPCHWSSEGRGEWQWHGPAPQDIASQLELLAELLGSRLLRLRAVLWRGDEAVPELWQGSGHRLLPTSMLPDWSGPLGVSSVWLNTTLDDEVSRLVLSSFTAP